MIEPLAAMLKEYGKEIIEVLDRESLTVIINSPMHFYDVERAGKDGRMWRGFILPSHTIIWEVR